MGKRRQRRRGLDLSSKKHLQFQELMADDDPFRQYIMGKITARQACLIALIVYNPQLEADEPDQIFNENNNEGSQDEAGGSKISSAE